MRTVLLITTLFVLLLSSSTVLAQDDKPITKPTIGVMLKLDRVGVGRRSTVNTDAIEYMVAKGTFTTSTLGSEVVAPDGSIKTWSVHTPNEDGSYPPIGGGWAYATINVEQDSTWIMRGRGYRHVYINGEPRAGDLYSLGIKSLPVRLNAGENSFLFKSGRGGLSVTFEPAPNEPFLETRDPTLPDYIRGNKSGVYAGVFITNPTVEWQSGLTVRASVEGSSIETHVPLHLPLHAHQLPVKLPACPEVDAETESLTVQ